MAVSSFTLFYFVAKIFMASCMRMKLSFRCKLYNLTLSHSGFTVFSVQHFAKTVVIFSCEISLRCSLSFYSKFLVVFPTYILFCQSFFKLLFLVLPPFYALPFYLCFFFYYMSYVFSIHIFWSLIKIKTKFTIIGMDGIDPTYLHLLSSF